MKNLFQKICSLVLVVSMTALSFAQTIDAKSKKILDDVTKNYHAKKNSYFKFTFGSGTNGIVNKREPGIFYSEGDKYKLKIMGTEQIFDGTKIYNINEEDMEVTIAKPNDSDVMFSPLNYLKTYRKNFNVSYVGKQEMNGKNTDLIKLVPIKSNGLKYVYLYVDSTNNQMVKLEQYGNNKDVAVIAIKEYKENQTLDANMFKYDKKKYADYIVTEL